MGESLGCTKGERRPCVPIKKRYSEALGALNPKGLIVAFGFLVSSCAGGFAEFPVTRDGQATLPEYVRTVPLSSDNIGNFDVLESSPVRTSLPQISEWSYRIGSGDVLSIIVFDHPELTLPAGSERSPAETGFQVQNDGTFFYPFVGKVRAGGLSLEAVRETLTERLAQYIADPQIDIRVAAYNSQHVSVTGEVLEPSRHAVTVNPLTLVEAVNRAGGFTEFADVSRTTVQRGGRVYRVDVSAFLNDGLLANNPVLLPSDVVTVPRRQVAEAYLLGQVSQAAAIDLSEDPVNLTQALARQGGIDEQRADARGVFVFRAQTEGVDVYQLNTELPVGLLLGTKFFLKPNDVVYVTRAPLQKWNDTISDILPTIWALVDIDDLSRSVSN